MQSSLILGYGEGMELGTLVQVLPVFNVTLSGDKCHKVFEIVNEEDHRVAFHVPQGTPGVFLETFFTGGLRWSKVLYPQGVGWVQSNWLRSLP